MDFFPDTKWTVLAEATLNSDDSGREALGKICLKYKDPVDKIIFKQGVHLERVEDVRQDFFLSLMQGSFFKRANKKQGKFRSFLLAALRQFLIDDFRKISAEKRGGGKQHTEVLPESASVEIDNTEFDLVWAETLFDAALVTVGEEISEKRGLNAWKMLQKFLSGNSDEQDYRALADLLSMSIGGAKAEVSRMRAKFRKQLRTEVSVTVSAPHEIDEELRYLKQAMMRIWGVGNA